MLDARLIPLVFDGLKARSEEQARIDKLKVIEAEASVLEKTSALMDKMAEATYLQQGMDFSTMCQLQIAMSETSQFYEVIKRDPFLTDVIEVTHHNREQVGGSLFSRLFEVLKNDL